jgi:hypothetical protein
LYAKNIIDTAFSYDDGTGATTFFEHVNFQPRASKAQKFYFLQNGPYLEEAEITPGNRPDTRIRPLALTNDHGR